MVESDEGGMKAATVLLRGDGMGAATVLLRGDGMAVTCCLECPRTSACRNVAVGYDPFCQWRNYHPRRPHNAGGPEGEGAISGPQNIF